MVIVVVDDGGRRRDYLMTAAEAYKLAGAIPYDVHIVVPDELEAADCAEVLEDWGL